MYYDDSYYGQFKDGYTEGYVTYKRDHGRSIVQYKIHLCYGYGIFPCRDREVYRGEFKNMKQEGYGYKKYENNDEYDGQWIDDSRHGEGIFKEASTGRIERRIYEEDEV